MTNTPPQYEEITTKATITIKTAVTTITKSYNHNAQRKRIKNKTNKEYLSI